LSHPSPPEWDDIAYIRAATGRRRLSAAELTQIGEKPDRFPLFC
jgi:hypothetical protein